MSDDANNSRRSSNASAIAAVVVLLPILYALSIGPTAFFLKKYPGTSMEKSATAFYAPIIWLLDHTSMRQPIVSYLEWWERLARKI